MTKQALHAATWAYFISATVYGVYSYGLLLATGNIFVPIAAHAVYDAFAFVRYHLKVGNEGWVSVFSISDACAL